MPPVESVTVASVATVAVVSSAAVSSAVSAVATNGIAQQTAMIAKIERTCTRIARLGAAPFFTITNATIAEMITRATGRTKYNAFIFITPNFI